MAKVLILTPTCNIKTERIKSEYDRIVREIKTNGICVITDLFDCTIADIDVVRSDDVIMTEYEVTVKEID